jgi:hypothetical protein
MVLLNPGQPNMDALALLTWLLLRTPCTSDPAYLEVIPRREGFWKAGSLPARYHNPGALRFAGQARATRGLRGYAVFETDEAGFEALERDVEGKIARGARLSKAWRYLPN